MTKGKGHGRRLLASGGEIVGGRQVRGAQAKRVRLGVDGICWTELPVTRRQACPSRCHQEPEGNDGAVATALMLTGIWYAPATVSTATPVPARSRARPPGQKPGVVWEAENLPNQHQPRQCQFTFRDPASGKVCKTGFAGGSAPFVRDGHVSLRGLYFQANDTKPEQGASPNGGPEHVGLAN